MTGTSRLAQSSSSPYPPDGRQPPRSRTTLLERDLAPATLVQLVQHDSRTRPKLISDWSAGDPPNLHTEIEAPPTSATRHGPAQRGRLPCVTISNVQGASTPTVRATQPPFPKRSRSGTYYATAEQHLHLGAGGALYATTPWQPHLQFGGQFDRTGTPTSSFPNYLGSYTFSNVSDWLNASPTGVTIEAPSSIRRAALYPD